MQLITKELALAIHAKSPRRKCFADHSAVQKKKERPTFSVFAKGVSRIFEAQTGLSLSYSKKHDNYWCFLTPAQIETAEAWERRQGKLIYLKDCLPISVALDTNLEDNMTGNHTHLGALESRAKNERNSLAIAELVEIVGETVLDMPYYKDAHFICAVPPSPKKDFDLPATLTAQISQKVGKPDITHGFVFQNPKSSVKGVSFEEKWDVWESTWLNYQQATSGVDIRDKTVVLIDDKYQSGMTIQFIAMKLQQAGVSQVYSLSVVKTLRDTDNL
jgi:predicted amidophosphoribosyltransferase